MRQELEIVSLNEDELCNNDYIDMFERLKTTNYNEFVNIIDSTYSKAFWSKWRRGKCHLPWRARNELRLASGLSLLPPSLAEIVGGIGRARIYVAGKVKDTIVIGDSEDGISVSIGGGGGVKLRIMKGGIKRSPRKQVCVSDSTFAQLSVMKIKHGMGWSQLMTVITDFYFDNQIKETRQDE